MYNPIPWLSNALALRDAEGNLVSLICPGGTDMMGRPIYYPVLPPALSSPAEPLLFEEDFRPGGKYYGQIFYQPGFTDQPLGMLPNGLTPPLDFSRIRYLDPRYNLPELSNLIQKEGLSPEQIPAASHLLTTLAAAKVPMDQREISESARDRQSLFLVNNKGLSVRVCNSKITVQRLVIEVSREHKAQTVELFLEGTGNTVQVPIEDLGHLDRFLASKCPEFCFSDTPNAATLINEHIRSQLRTVPKHTVFRSPGWHLFEGTHIFVQDHHRSPQGATFDCGRSIEVPSQCDAAQAFRNALGILEIGNLKVTLPLLLTALLGPLTMLFEEAGHAPRYALFLHGLTGSLKTATAKVFCQVFDDLSFATFRDTTAAIDVSIAEHWDQVLLVDDFQPPVSAADGRAMRKTLEHILRLFGDGIAKRRSNTSATAAKGTRPRGTCIITGESAGGSYSSFLRCLLVSIDRGDINGDRLRIYQEEPSLWTGNLAFFLPWIGSFWDQLADTIHAEFAQWRQHFSTVTPEPRLADTGAVLMLTASIFLRYGGSCGGISGPEQQRCLEVWEGTITSLLTVSTEESREVDAVTLACEALLSAQASGHLLIAPDVEHFETGQDGFLSHDRLWLLPKAFDRILRQYCQDTHIACVLTRKEVLPQLYQAGLLVRDEEQKKGSFLKRSAVIPALGRRFRMVSLLYDALFRDEASD